MATQSVKRVLAVVVSMGSWGCGQAAGSTTIWNTNLDFREFSGQPGGFEAVPVTLQSAGNPGPAERAYDVLRRTGTDAASGMAIYGEGQDGQTDLWIRTQVMDGSGGRWASARAAKGPGGYSGGATIDQATSRSGDYAVVAMEFRFAAGVELSADQFALSVASANGMSEVYEWMMVTVGSAAAAPFSAAGIAGYRPTDYSSTASGTFLDSSGALTGNAGTGAALAHGRSMSQFLSGAPGAPTSGGLVQPGWYAIDDYNTLVFDGPESERDNPLSGTGAGGRSQILTGADLGLAPETTIDSFTVWFGYFDVGFDTDGDGFTSTDGSPLSTLTGLGLGCTPDLASVPEPSLSLLAAFGSVGLLVRRRR